MKTTAIAMKKISWIILAGWGLVLFIAAHVLVAWSGIKLNGRIDGWFPWTAAGVLMTFGLYHVIRHIHGKDHGHSHLFGGHAPDRAEVERGPHDGFLVNVGHGFVEITIFETDAPPRFRLFFQNQRKQTRSVPAHATVKIETVRPDGARQTFAFCAKGEYLESTDYVPEPHEFKAIVQISHGNHTHPPHEVQFSDHDQAHYAQGAPRRTSTGKVIRGAFLYDVLFWLVSRGKEQAYRERLIDLARLTPGDSVLDVGCGTGTLAIAAKRRVGPAGRANGIDAAAEMIARARKKAMKAAIEVNFENAVVEELPFPDATFDAVLCTMMLHHLPEDALRQCVREIRRVLKPGGRFLAVDFGGPATERRSWHFRHHTNFDLREIVPLLSGASLSSIESGAVGKSYVLASDLQFILTAAVSGA